MVKDDWLSERGTVWEIAGRCEISGLEENRDLAEVNCVIFFETELLNYQSKSVRMNRDV